MPCRLPTGAGRANLLGINTQRKFRGPTAAFTLVEVMMASTILVVGFIGMIQAVTLGSEMLATAQRQQLANQILQHEAEKLRLLSWSEIQALSNQSAATYADTQFSNAVASSGVTFQLARDVSTPTTNFYEVTFTITWTKSGTTSATNSTAGSWLDQMAFYRPSPTSRTYTRKTVTYLGKHGLLHAYQRS